MTLSTTDFEWTVPFHDVAVFLGNFGDTGMAWAFVDIIEEHLHDIVAALGFTLDLFMAYMSSQFLFHKEDNSPCRRWCCGTIPSRHTAGLSFS